MNKNRAPFGVLLVSVLLAALSAIGVHAPSEAASWWNDSYRYRRQVVIIRTGQRWAKAPAAWAKFHCAGALRDDANDVRVVTSKGKLVKSTVKGVGPGDEVLVVYEAPENEDEYYIYYGNPDAQPPAEYNPERGLLLETRRRVSGDPDSWKQMQDILKRSDFVYGRGYVDKVFDGYNHFGPVEDYISIYRGWLMAPKTGTYTFCTASDDASFMFVNDKLVCKWPGYHPANAGAWGKFSGTIYLEKGVYKFAYYHLQATQQAACVAGWKQPGMEDEDVSLIPDWAFPGLAEATVKHQQDRNAKFSVDFRLTVTDDLSFEENSFHRVAFTPLVPNSVKVGKYEWSFGDGASTTKKMPSHVFLEPGIYPVTLKVTDENGASNSVTHRIKAIYTVKPIDRGYILEKRAKEFLADISDHDPALLKADQLIALWNFYELVEDETARRAFAMEFLKRLEDLPPDEIGDIAVKVGDFILEQMGMPDKALTAYEAVASSAGIITRSRGLIRKGDVYLFYKDDPRKARELYSKAVELLENTGADELRFAYIRMGDASKYFGQLEDAQNWYGKAEAILLQGRTPRETLVMKGAYAQTVESCIRSEEYEQAIEQLDMWEWEFPLERLEGYSTYLRCKVLLARGKYAKCVSEANALVKVNPASNYADKLLLISARAYEKLNDITSALRALSKLIVDYPASPIIDEAKSLRDKLRR